MIKPTRRDLFNGLAEKWKRHYFSAGARWKWNPEGDETLPHAALTTAVHADQFLNTDWLNRDPLLVEEAATDMITVLEAIGFDFDQPDYVAGPVYGSTCLAFCLASLISRHRDRHCYSVPILKTGCGAAMKMSLRGCLVEEGDEVLIVDDVLATGGSLHLAREAVLAEGALVIPTFLVMANRMDVEEIPGGNVLALMKDLMPTYAISKCPICEKTQDQSKAIYPKEGKNWRTLMAPKSSRTQATAKV